MAADKRTGLRIEIGTENLSDEEKARLAQSLGQELSRLNEVRNVWPATHKAPEGARPIEGFSWGALIVALAPVALTQVIGLLREWARRPGGQPVKISIQIDDRKPENGHDPAAMNHSEVEELAKQLRAATGE